MESFAYKTKAKDPLLIDVFSSVFKYVQQAFLVYFYCCFVKSYACTVAVSNSSKSQKLANKHLFYHQFLYKHHLALNMISFHYSLIKLTGICY